MSSTDTNPVPRALFVYYKVPGGQAPAMLPLVKAFQQRLRREWPDLSCELMQRPQPSADGTLTWMEVYRQQDGVEESTMASIERLASEFRLPSPRMNEVFVPLA